MVLPMPRMERKEILLSGSPRRFRLSTGIGSGNDSSKFRSQVISQRLQDQPSLLVPHALPSAAQSIPIEDLRIGKGGETPTWSQGGCLWSRLCGILPLPDCGTPGGSHTHPEP